MHAPLTPSGPDRVRGGRARRAAGRAVGGVWPSAHARSSRLQRLYTIACRVLRVRKGSSGSRRAAECIVRRRRAPAGSRTCLEAASARVWFRAAPSVMGRASRPRGEESAMVRIQLWSTRGRCRIRTYGAQCDVRTCCRVRWTTARTHCRSIWR
ncbi:hypothetical protein B0H14DRAFT_1061190 [Mycena olivaceomarginata]|nr:hypothetical protein B0H14DRAFT_1061190 [Mycena olivaceomarginata]